MAAHADVSDPRRRRFSRGRGPRPFKFNSANANCQLATGRALEGRPGLCLGGRLCRVSTQARRYTQGTLARYATLRRSAGVRDLEEAEVGRDLEAPVAVLGLLGPPAL